MQFQVKLIIFIYLKTEHSLASKVHFCGLDLLTASLCWMAVGLNPIWGSDFYCALLWLILYISLYFLYNILYSMTLVGSYFLGETILATDVTA